MDGRMDRGTDRQIDKQTDKRTHRETHGQMDKRREGRTEVGWMYRWKHGLTDKGCRSVCETEEEMERDRERQREKEREKQKGEGDRDMRIDRRRRVLQRVWRGWKKREREGAEQGKGTNGKRHSRETG